MTVKLQHEDGENTASKVTVHYDNKIENLEIDENGTVEVENQAQAEELIESHGKFFKLNEEDTADHVLEGKTVDEVREYVSDIEDVERLKELREFEDRKTGKEAIDERISEIKEPETPEVEEEQEQEVEQEDEPEGDGEEDGEEDQDDE